MDNITRTNYYVNETLCEKRVEQALQTQVDLPEYCPDITSVLQCFIFENITSGSLSGDAIGVEGNALIRLLYLNEGEVYSYEQSVPFSKQIEYSGETVGTLLEMNTYLQYVNCRAVSPRRIEVGGTFVIYAKLSAAKTDSVINDITRADIQLNKDCISACSICGNASQLVNLSQVIDIGTDKPQMKSILRNMAYPIIERTKQVAGKVLVKGELKIKTIYKAEDGSIQYIENALPISQIIDIEGMDENSTIDLQAKLYSLDIAMKPNALGNMSLLDINALVNLAARAYNCIDFPVLKDAYSTDFKSECSFKQVEVDRIVSDFNGNYMHTIETKTSPAIKKVIDVWCDDVRVKAGTQEEKIVFSGSIKYYLLYEDENEKLNLKSAQEEFSFTEQIGTITQLKCEPSAIIAGSDYVLNENGILLRVNIAVHAVIFERMTQRVVDDIRFSEKGLPAKHSLYIYYSHEGEALWDIARRFQTTVEAIQKENAIDAETLTTDMPLMFWA